MTLLAIPPKLAAARVLLSRREPYLSAAIWRLSLHVLDPWPASMMGEIAADVRGRVICSAGLVEQSTVEQLAGCLAHEIGHLVRLHHARRGPRDPRGWNMAGDRAINPDVLAAWPLPYKGCMPADLDMADGLTAEAYYDGEASQDEGEDGDGPDGEPGDKPGRGRHKCGSAAGDRHPAEDELPGGPGEPGDGDPADPADGDAPGDAPGAGDPDWSATAAQVAHAIREASKARGNVAGGWQRWADDHLTTPRPDWRRVLAVQVRSVLKAAGASDYTYSRPSRRGHATPAILPSLRAPVIRAAIVDDTSGSMSDAQAKANIADVAAILKAAGARDVRYIACDAAVHADVTVRDAAGARAHQKGGGGTDMRLGIDRAARPDKHGNRTDICIVLTDGYTPWPDHAPRGMRVIIRLPDGGPETPGWARRVECAD